MKKKKRKARQSPKPGAPFHRLRIAGRVVVVLLLAAGLVWAWSERGAFDPATIRDRIAHYPAAPLIFLFAQLLASLLFIPRTVLAVAAGLLFGVWMGTLWAALGSVTGAVAGFWVARYVNDGFIDLEHLPRLGPVLLRAERGGWRAVAALRLIPVVPHSLANYALGLTQLPLGSYALGSFLGQLPMTVAYVEFGAAGGRLMAGQTNWVWPVTIGVLALGLTILLPKLWKR
jgi:uncharacterized membrane protein YdjX (TVP38/TMEM64 family)